MSWTIYCVENTTHIPAECAKKVKDLIGDDLQIQDKYYGRGSILDAVDGEDGPLFFDTDHSEHMDWISGDATDEFFAILEEFKVNGEVHFMDPDRGEPVFWGHRWVDGKYSALTGEYNVTWTEDSE